MECTRKDCLKAAKAHNKVLNMALVVGWAATAAVLCIGLPRPRPFILLGGLLATQEVFAWGEKHRLAAFGYQCLAKKMEYADMSRETMEMLSLDKLKLDLTSPHVFFK